MRSVQMAVTVKSGHNGTATCRRAERNIQPRHWFHISTASRAGRRSLVFLSLRRCFMRDRLSFRAGLLAASVMLSGAGLFAFADASPVAAQGLIFDWGDNDKTVDSGKSHVRFNGGGKPGDIIVSFGDRKLYHIVAPGEADTYPIAIPREQSRWEGVTSVTNKRENPSWTPTAHMLAENPKLPRWVPGGHPMNPLGNRAMYLGSSDYRIHGTDAPWTIGTPASKGCVRMFNKDVADLYPRVKVGAKVTVTWQKFDGKTLAMTGHEPAKGIVEPDAKTGKATLASFTPESAGEEPVNQSKKPVEDNDEAQSAQPAAQPAQQEEQLALRKRKPKPRLPEPQDHPVIDGKEAAETVAAADVAKSESTKPDAEKAADKVDATKDEPIKEPAARPHRRKAVSHSKSVTSDQSVETGSIPKASETASAAKTSSGKANASKNDESLALAERAMAAAERAAAAAERAAAAAERAVAAAKPQAAAPAAESSETSSH
jgi:hypothetical protein